MWPHFILTDLRTRTNEARRGRRFEPNRARGGGARFRGPGLRGHAPRRPPGPRGAGRGGPAGPRCAPAASSLFGHVTVRHRDAGSHPLATRGTPLCPGHSVPGTSRGGLGGGRTGRLPPSSTPRGRGTSAVRREVPGIALLTGPGVRLADLSVPQFPCLHNGAASEAPRLPHSSRADGGVDEERRVRTQRRAPALPPFPLTVRRACEEAADSPPNGPSTASEQEFQVFPRNVPRGTTRKKVNSSEEKKKQNKTGKIFWVSRNDLHHC